MDDVGIKEVLPTRVEGQRPHMGDESVCIQGGEALLEVKVWVWFIRSRDSSPYGEGE